ncbi:hypothetical protein DL96DRAFT_1590648 [Flagelloscypha sp. PMI_526]|nr:hypothetical protein DL96DRAFT_1590648 [Flagelloscypha sp. PMI_526]
MVQIIRNPQLVPRYLRRLVYTSIILSFITFGVSMVNFGQMSLWISSAAIAFTWIYHLVLIIKHNKSPLSSRHELLWQTKQPLVWGYCLAVLWTFALFATLIFMTILFYSWEYEYLMTAQFACAVVEVVGTTASTAVMWSLIGVATHLRKVGGARDYLHKRPGPREFVQGLEHQEQSQAV